MFLRAICRLRPVCINIRSVRFVLGVGIEQEAFEHICHSGASFLRLSPTNDETQSAMVPDYKRADNLKCLLENQSQNVPSTSDNWYLLNTVWSEVAEQIENSDSETLQCLLRDLSYLDRNRFYNHKRTDFVRHQTFLRLRSSELLESSPENLLNLGIVLYKMCTERDWFFETVIERLSALHPDSETPSVSALGLMALVSRQITDSTAGRLERHLLALREDVDIVSLLALAFFRTQQWFKMIQSASIVSNNIVKCIEKLSPNENPQDPAVAVEYGNAIALSLIKCVRREYSFMGGNEYEAKAVHDPLMQRDINYYSYMIWVNIANYYEHMRAYHRDFMVKLEHKLLTDISLTRCKDVSVALHTMVLLGHEIESPHLIEEIVKEYSSRHRQSEAMRFPNWYAALLHAITSYHILPIDMIRVVFSDRFLDICQRQDIGDRFQNFAPFQALHFVDTTLGIWLPRYTGKRLPEHLRGRIDVLKSELRTVWDGQYASMNSRFLIEIASILQTIINGEPDCIQIGHPLPHYNYTGGKMVPMPQIPKVEYMTAPTYDTLKVPAGEKRIAILPIGPNQYLSNVHQLEGKVLKFRTTLKHLGYTVLFLDGDMWRKSSNRREFMWRFLGPFLPDEAFSCTVEHLMKQTQIRTSVADRRLGKILETNRPPKLFE